MIFQIFFHLILFFSKWKIRRENNFTNSKMADQGKPTDQTPNHPSRYKCDIVVALDVGTSYSGYAYSDKKEIKREDINLNEWSGNFTHDKKAKCPTVVMLNEDKSFNSFGYKAEDFYAKMVKDKTHLKYYRFRDFKMKLYHEKVIIYCPFSFRIHLKNTHINHWRSFEWIIF